MTTEAIASGPSAKPDEASCTEAGARLARIVDRYGLRELYALGSRAAEAEGVAEGRIARLEPGGSDLDLAFRAASGERLTARQAVRLVAELEDFFGAGRADLIDLDRADPFLAVEALRGALLYCRDGREQAEYELYVLRRAGDLAFFQRRRVAAVLTEGAR